jgi:hypothetical protein
MERSHESRESGGHHGLLERLRAGWRKLRRTVATSETGTTTMPTGTGTTGTGLTMSGRQIGTRVPSQQEQPSEHH